MSAQPDLLTDILEKNTSLALGTDLRVPTQVFSSLALLRYEADTGEAFMEAPRPDNTVVRRHPKGDAVLVTLLAPGAQDGDPRVCQYRIGVKGDVVPALYPWIQSKNVQLRFQSDFITSYRIQQLGGSYTAQVLCKLTVGQRLEYVWKDWLVSDEHGILHEYHDGAEVTLGQAAKFASLLHAQDLAVVKNSASVWHQPLNCGQLPAFRSLPYSTSLLDFQRRYLAPRQSHLTMDKFSRSFSGRAVRTAS